MSGIVTFRQVEEKVLAVRGQQVILDRDLAEMYGVETRALNQAVKRNAERFPDDFMFQLTSEELQRWKSQIVMSNSINMGLRSKPYAFTELGVAMLSSVLNSKLAIQVNISIMRAFAAIRQLMFNPPNAAKVQELVNEISEIVQRQDKADAFVFEEFGRVYEIINQLTEQKRQLESKPKPPFGYAKYG